jgi:hypothetical protein
LVEVKGCSEASSMTALVWPSKSTGSTTMLTAAGLAEAGADGDEIRRHIGEQDALLLDRALADEPSPSAMRSAGSAAVA